MCLGGVGDVGESISTSEIECIQGGENEANEKPSHATPHHIAFVADPQLVDPHTYPDRPWPLSTLTIKYTDQYMRRSFSLIQRKFGPDSVLFLGDLFDGGREWATETTSSPEERFQKYRNAFWKEEYERFGRVFSAQFAQGDAQSTTSPRDRRMMASLPGNHDQGFGSGVQVPVRERFQMFFGNGNRVDVLGNHTVVGVDTVSLSAMDQPDPETGSTQANAHIWKQAEEFLNGIDAHRATAETRELHTLQGKTRRDSGFKFEHAAMGVDQPVEKQQPQVQSVGLPTILLSHVPLYRKPATPCGPLRERYPPSSSNPTGELEDEPNALQLSGGYQYQNVLTQTISNTLVSKIGSRLVQVYSGDDHDYCEIAHREFSGSPREITVKSLSWAMGVRRPGFLLTSLWNPINPTTGESIDTTTTTTGTLQNHLCLLPDQLSVFIWYGLTLAFTVFVLLARSITTITHPSRSVTPILPLSEAHPSSPSSSHIPRSSISSSTLLSISPHGLASRATSAPRSSATYLDKDSLKDFKPSSRRTSRGIWQAVAAEFSYRVLVVARVVLVVYALLIWRW